tara:strand:+ start:172 stop:732 length:561 start_codon:yes stop_codon:yes gene_type:complete
MEYSRRKFNKYNAQQDSLDKRVDQFFEVGRQFVDGVAGNRPGKRTRQTLTEFSRQKVQNVGHWVSDKMDSLFEDESEDWGNDDSDEGSHQYKSFSRSSRNKDSVVLPKRPLEAISLRLRNNSKIVQKQLSPAENKSNETWEEDSFFQINKWQRPAEKLEEVNLDQMSKQRRSSKSRNLPRSRRRRI